MSEESEREGGGRECQRGERPCETMAKQRENEENRWNRWRADRRNMRKGRVEMRREGERVLTKECATEERILLLIN